MISFNSVSKEFSAKPLFDNISFVINPRDRVALAGKNGAGKTTMLRMIAGLETPTSGSLAIPKELTIGYLPQHIDTTDTVTLKEETAKAFERDKEVIALSERLNRELAERTDYESESYAKLIERASLAADHAAIVAASNPEAEIEKTLMGLGFLRSDFDRPTSEFSGGWRMRIELAKILLAKPDVLLLDEPTNHLDIESIQWLENFLITKAKAVVLVSHDRAFIDNVTSRTLEISLGKVYDYNVNYSKYVVLREERLEQQRRAYQNQQKQIADTEQFIERFRYKATKAVQVQSRMKQLAKIERIELDEIDRSHISLKFPPAPRSGDFPVIAENVGKAYGEHQVFDNATFTIRRGEKVAFVGKNGMGKSTMVKCLIGEIPYSGMLKLGHNVKIGYFAQNQASLMNPDITVFDTIDRVAVGDIRLKIKDILGAFIFGGEASEKKVGVLSGGEKTRLAMIRLLLEPVNLLILDEPTNHLDMVTKDVLKQAIKAFDGTVIVVSHDREFLDGLVEKVYEFTDGKVKECIGGIYDFLEKKRISSLTELELTPSNTAKTASTVETAKTKEAEPSPATQKKLTYAEQRERDKTLKRLKKKVTEAETEISRLEGEVKAIEDKIAAGDASDEILKLHAETSKQLENAMSIWELASMEAEEFENGLQG